MEKPKTKLQMVKEFNNKIVKLEGVRVAKCLAPERVEWFMNCVHEELEEFQLAHSNGDCAGMLDALVDMTYFILGRVQECGFTEAQWDKAFQIVHECNMEKHAGDKQRGSKMDAVKDKDWVGPEAFLKELLNCHFDCPLTISAHCDNKSELFASDKVQEKIKELDLAEKIKKNYPPLKEILAPITCDTIEDNAIQHRGPSVYVDLANGEQLILDKDELEIIGNMPKVFFEVTKLSMKKSQDYNNGNSTPTSRAAYFPFGLLSYAQMLHTKSQRLNSLAQQDKMPNNESVRDTLLDMINYASFAVDAIDKGEV